MLRLRQSSDEPSPLQRSEPHASARQFLHRAQQGLPQIEARQANRLEYTGLFNRSSMRRLSASG
jgi:hypothetical protein